MVAAVFTVTYLPASSHKVDINKKPLQTVDDHFQSVSNCSANVMYKAAGRAFLVHGGAGSHINHTLIVTGGIGIFQTNAAAKAAVSGLALYDNGTLKRGDKGDYEDDDDASDHSEPLWAPVSCETTGALF